MRATLLVLAAAAAAACGAPQAPREAPTGAIAGRARDHASGDPVARAEIHVLAQGAMRPLFTTSSDRGVYDVAHLRPGRYRVSAKFAGQPVEVVNIDVRAGEVTLVDLVFTLGRPAPIVIDHQRAP